jgi:hypothetical protein
VENLGVARRQEAVKSARWMRRMTEPITGIRGHVSVEADGVGVRLPPSFSQDRTAAWFSSARVFRCGRRRAFEAATAAAAAIPAIASNVSQRLSMYMEHPFVPIIKARRRGRPWNEG